MSSKFSLIWFKSKKQEELASLMVENQKLQNAILQRKLDKLNEKEAKAEEKEDVKLADIIASIESGEKETMPEKNVTIPEVMESLRAAKDIKPYKNVKLVNDVLVVVTNDGEILTKTPANAMEFEKIKNATLYEEVLNVISPKASVEFKEAVKEIQKVVQIKTKLERLAEFKDFTLEKGSLYLTGINRTLPELMVNEFANIIAEYATLSNEAIEIDLTVNDHYQGLKNFFMWCCLNPHPETAKELYKFLMKNSFRITKQGFFAALRNVVTVKNSAGEESNKELLDFLSNAYVKIKATWKKNPINFTVYLGDDKEYKFIKTEDIAKPAFQEKNYTVLGNLKELYTKLPDMEENRYTDDRTKTFDIRVGKRVNMPYKDCSWSTADCNEAGLHFTADQINYVGCGDTSVLILINPMKVVGIGTSKGRCYEYLPIMTVARDEATTLLHDLNFDTLTLDDDFALGELEELSKMTAEGYVSEDKKFSFNIEKTGLVQIVKSLKEMKKEISERIKKLA